MSQRCLLTIYEPQKDPRIIELQVNRSNSEENDISVYNEDGTIVQDYQLFVETADNRLIKANDIPETKSNTLKLWKRWKSDISCDRACSSVVGEVPVSETTRCFLRTYEINTAKKERKIARTKEWRKLYAEKKQKNKLKKQRKQELKRFFSEPLPNKMCPPPSTLSLPSKKSIKRARKRIAREQQCKLDAQNESPAVTMNRSRKRSKRKRKEKEGAAQKQDHTIVKPQRKETAGAAQKQDHTIVKPHVLDEVVKNDSPSIRWKASEPAADFIPVIKSDQKSYREESASYLSFNTSKNSYWYSKNSSHPQSHDNEFIGISQKAFFLQC